MYNSKSRIQSKNEDISPHPNMNAPFNPTDYYPESNHLLSIDINSRHFKQPSVLNIIKVFNNRKSKIESSPSSQQQQSRLNYYKAIREHRSHSNNKAMGRDDSGKQSPKAIKPKTCSPIKQNWQINKVPQVNFTQQAENYQRHKRRNYDQADYSHLKKALAVVEESKQFQLSSLPKEESKILLNN